MSQSNLFDEPKRTRSQLESPIEVKKALRGTLFEYKLDAGKKAYGYLVQHQLRL